nr:MAG TPA_asm: Helix-turn-helix XRE-family like protein [Caudoviricetes sp.]
MVKIKQIREQKNISKYELCKRTGIQFNTLTYIERGDDTKLSTLVKIANALDVDIKDLF